MSLSISERLVIAYGSSQKQIVSALAALAISSAMIGAGALGLLQACFCMKETVLSAFSWVVLGSGFCISAALFCIGAYRIYQDKEIKQKALLDKNFWDILETLENTEGSVEKLERWIIGKANLHAENKLGQTPLIYLLLNKDLDTEVFSQMAQMLLNHGVDIHTSVNGKPALHWLIESSLQWKFWDSEILVSRLEWLFSQHVDVNQKNVNGDTALHIAVAEPDSIHSILWIGQLLSHHADREVLDKQNCTPLQKIRSNTTGSLENRRRVINLLEGS
jgi:hypothetical protein